MGLGEGAIFELGCHTPIKINLFFPVFFQIKNNIYIFHHNDSAEGCTTINPFKLQSQMQRSLVEQPHAITGM